MEILARAVGRRKEAVAQVQIVRGSGQFLINDKSAKEYLHDNLCSLRAIKEPFSALEKTEHSLQGLAPTSIFNFETLDTHIKVKGGGLIGQAEAIKLGIARALCDIEALTIDFNNVASGDLVNNIEDDNASGSTAAGSLIQHNEVRKQLKTKGFLTQDARVKERRKYGLKKARKASQYHKR